MTITGVFARCRSEGRAAFIPYLMAGDPSLGATPALLAAISSAGADIIEVGIPYSDPLADGPTIQAAAQRALRAGASFDAVLEMARSLDRSAVPAPLIAFTYFNPLFVRGIERTAADLSRAGFAGAIIPDLPPEEAGEVERSFARHTLDLTFLVAPTTPLERVRAIAQGSTSFVYVVSRMGVTGAGSSLRDGVKELVARLRSVVDKPLAVGFGVSTPEHAATVSAFADGVIVGSALIDEIAKFPSAPAQAAEEFCRTIAASLKSVPEKTKQ